MFLERKWSPTRDAMLFKASQERFFFLVCKLHVPVEWVIITPPRLLIAVKNILLYDLVNVK